MLVPRNLKTALLEAATDTPVVLVNGARQTGKSTLIKALFSGSSNPPEYMSFDDLGLLNAARRDPQSFVEMLPESVIIDEIQRAPEVMLPIKYSVDRNRRPGRFFLTGSANVLALPKVVDTLVGRIEIHTLWPLSQGEIRLACEAFVDTIFGDSKLQPRKSLSLSEVIDLMCVGGYPDAFMRETPSRRKNWFAGYITALIERDVRDLRHIEQLTQMPKLLEVIGSRTGGLLNYSDIARSLEMKLTTVKMYIALLELLFLVVPLRPWFSNIGKRLVKSPKIYVNDTGLLCHLLGLVAQAIARNGSLLGKIYENFVLMELIKQISWSKTNPRLYHFRTENGEEVDMVLEGRDGRIVGIECKATSLVSGVPKGLQTLRALTGKKFHRGIVLYLGSHVIGIDKGIDAVPVSALWQISSGAAPALEY
ncbi:MAG: ATP-binding protein [Candidatus Melainabacteria bacterium]|nr:ATP-binding protein [Candidatus Melainabacteria bacterium]